MKNLRSLLSPKDKWGELLNKYEIFLEKCQSFGVNVFEKEMINKGLYCDGYVWLNKSLSTNEKLCILAEELGHHLTSSGNILDLKDTNNKIQENKARVWSYNELLQVDDIKETIKKNRCRNIYELAEELNVSEEFLKETLEYYINSKSVKF